MRGKAVIALTALLGFSAACAGGASSTSTPSAPCHAMSGYTTTGIGLVASTAPTPGFKLALGSQPVGLIADGESAWVLATGSSQVLHVMPDGSTVEFILPPSGLGLQLSRGADGTVWVPERFRNAIASIAPDGTTVRECTVPGRGAGPMATSVAAGGSVWVSETRGAIAHLVDGRFVEYAIGIAGSQGADVLAAAGGGAWFTVNGAAVLGRITASGEVQRIPIGISITALGLLATSDGAVWVADFGGDQVVRVASDGSVSKFTTSSGAKPQSLALAGDGAVWFTESGGDHHSRVRAATVDEAIRTGSWPDHMAITSGGWAWFTEYNDDRLGRVRLPAA